jgi:L-seryl-tRNA(Ser) seleniumtransferase
MKQNSTGQTTSDSTKARLRSLPAVDAVLSHTALETMRASLPRDLVTGAVRDELVEVRHLVREGSSADASVEALALGAARRLAQSLTPGLRPVINATGVILHTNLGRAPLSRSALEAIAANAAYSNLEYDLEAGERGSRYDHASALLRRVTGAQDALVVNNNAAALVLVLTVLASGREVVLSRGQAVEIGGGFRIPDIMESSGAHLVEVGTTNRTYVADYERAIGPETAAIMRVHASNFRVVGFATSPTIEELADLAHRAGIVLLDDVGSGALIDPVKYGLSAEPLVQASLAAGADLVLFSGDKLLGGPQCGIIVGNDSIVSRLKRHPLARALRVDKLTLSALEATLLHYIRGEAEREVPVWRMISFSLGQLRYRSDNWAAQLIAAGIPCQVVEGSSTVGGGSLPSESLPTWLVALKPRDGAATEETGAGHLSAALRRSSPPVVCRVDRGLVLLDPRTVLDGQEHAMLDAIVRAYSDA